MKHTLTLLLVVVFISGCKKPEDIKPPAVQQNADTQFVPPRSPQMEEAFQHLDRMKVKSDKGALDQYLNLADGGPVPPHLLPAKNVKLVSRNDTSATYTFVSGSTGIKAKIILKRIIAGKDTAWDVLSVGEIVE